MYKFEASACSHSPTANKSIVNGEGLKVNVSCGGFHLYSKLYLHNGGKLL